MYITSYVSIICLSEYHVYGHVGYLCVGGLIMDCSKIEFESLIWELTSGVELGSLFSSALVFSMKLS